MGGGVGSNNGTNYGETFFAMNILFYHELFILWPGLFEGGSAWDGVGGVRKVPAAYNSKTINDNEMKFGRVVKNH